MSEKEQLSEMDEVRERGGILSRVFRFYYDGFRNMSWWGRRVWLIILIKLFVIFVVLKLFFFPNFLKVNFSTERERSDWVLEQLTGNN